MLAKAEDEARYLAVQRYVAVVSPDAYQESWRMSVNRSSGRYFRMLTQDWSRPAQPFPVRAQLQRVLFLFRYI